MRTRHTIRGFSIIETLISVALFVILGGIAFSFLNRGTQDAYYVQSMADSASALLKTARFRSILEQSGQTWGVHFDNTGTPFYTMFSGTYSATSTNTKYYLQTLTTFQSPTSGASLDVAFQQATGNLVGATSSRIIITSKRDPTKGKVITINQFGGINTTDFSLYEWQYAESAPFRRLIASAQQP